MISAHTQSVVANAKQIYETQLRAKLEANHRDQFVAIEPESGEYFLGATYGQAVQAAQRAYPNRISFVLRIGHEAAIHLGGLTN